jgi:hypothetical protein
VCRCTVYERKVEFDLRAALLDNGSVVRCYT